MSSYSAQNPTQKSPNEKSRVDPASPIDSVVTNLLQTIHRKGRGFVLDTAREGDKVVIEVKESLPPHDEFESKTSFRDHKINDTESLIVYAKRYGDANKSLVFVSPEVCTLVLDEEVERGEREWATLTFKKSDDWNDWAKVVNKPHKHRDLGMFLLQHVHNLEDPTIVQRLMSMKASATVDHNSELNEFGTSEVGFKFKTSAGEEFAKFPREFGINIPVLDQDVGDNDKPPAKLKVRLQIEMPNGPADYVKFTPIVVEWNQAIVIRTREEIKTIRAALPEWTIVHGTFAEKDRVYGENVD